MAAGRVLIVEDDRDVRTMLAEYLGSNGYDVAQADGGDAMRAALAERVPQVVLLDVRLPGEDGLALARYLRERYELGIIMVTAAGEVVDRIVGLEMGADDYVAKPFDLRELLARVRAVLRRLEGSGPADAVPAAPAPAPRGAPAWRFAGYTLDSAARRLLDPRGAEIELTSGEFDLLCAFATHPGRVLSRDFLLEHTRGREAGPFDRTIDVQVGRLRKKIEADAEHPQIIKSVRGAGYILVPPVTQD